MVITAFGNSLPQALAIAISPIPIVAVILVLVSDRGKANGPVFAAGWLLGVFAAAGVAFAVSDAAGVATDSDAADAGGGFQLVLGLLFAVLALRQWQKRPAPGEEPPPPKMLAVIETAPPLRAFGIGLAASTLNPKSLPLALSGGVAIAETGAVGGDGLVSLLMFSLVASASVIAPVIAALALGERSAAPLDATKDWLLANNSTIMMVLLTVLSAVMVGSGLEILG